jgi:hypothetical protein
VSTFQGYKFKMYERDGGKSWKGDGFDPNLYYLLSND